MFHKCLSRKVKEKLIEGTVGFQRSNALPQYGVTCDHRSQALFLANVCAINYRLYYCSAITASFSALNLHEEKYYDAFPL